jgi:Tetratrico peptide repeat/Acetyltransferase (GNAT) domain
MTEVQTAHTADLDAATLRAARALLDAAFEGEMTDDDWEHTRGGMHALAWEGHELVGHAAVVQRRLLHGGRALRTGYVEGVGVSASRRGRGYGAAGRLRETGAMTDSSWERRMAELWASIDEHAPADFLARVQALAAARPPEDAIALFELASANDSTGHPREATPLYQRALAAGLTGEHRRRATIRYANDLVAGGAA